MKTAFLCIMKLRKWTERENQEAKQLMFYKAIASQMLYSLLLVLIKRAIMI